MLAFRSLDPFRALREPDCRRRDEKRPFPLRTKNCQHNPKQPLDRKSPIQVMCEPEFRVRNPCGSPGRWQRMMKWHQSPIWLACCFGLQGHGAARPPASAMSMREIPSAPKTGGDVTPCSDNPDVRKRFGIKQDTA